MEARSAKGLKKVAQATARGHRRTLDKFAAVLGTLTVVLLLIAGAFSPMAHAAFPGASGKIAFQSYRDGNWEIYAMNADGSGQTRLTSNSAGDTQPAWSPDGT